MSNVYKSLGTQGSGHITISGLKAPVSIALTFRDSFADLVTQNSVASIIDMSGHEANNRAFIWQSNPDSGSMITVTPALSNTLTTPNQRFLFEFRSDLVGTVVLFDDHDPTTDFHFNADVTRIEIIDGNGTREIEIGDGTLVDPLGFATMTVENPAPNKANFEINTPTLIEKTYTSVHGRVASTTGYTDSNTYRLDFAVDSLPTTKVYLATSAIKTAGYEVYFLSVDSSGTVLLEFGSAVSGSWVQQQLTLGKVNAKTFNSVIWEITNSTFFGQLNDEQSQSMSHGFDAAAPFTHAPTQKIGCFVELTENALPSGWLVTYFERLDTSGATPVVVDQYDFNGGDANVTNLGNSGGTLVQAHTAAPVVVSVDTTVRTITHGSTTFTDVSGGTSKMFGTDTTPVQPAEDTTAPTLTLNGSSVETIEVGSTWVDQGATFTDNVDTTHTVYTSSIVDTSTVRTITVNYQKSDAAGNISNTVTRTINVVTATTRKVIVIAGQSNAVGWRQMTDAQDSDYTLGTYPVQNRVKQIGVNDRTLRDATNPLDHHDEPVNSMGFWKTMVQDVAGEILLVPCAKGGSTFYGSANDSWTRFDDPNDARGIYYNTCRDMINEALSINGDNTLHTFTWFQGEADIYYSVSKAAYIERMTQLRNGLIQDTAMDEYTPWVCFVPRIFNTDYDARAAIIREALTEWLATVPNARLIETSDVEMPTNDRFHYTAEAYRTLGTRAAVAVNELTKPRISVVGDIIEGQSFQVKYNNFLNDISLNASNTVTITESSGVAPHTMTVTALSTIKERGNNGTVTVIAPKLPDSGSSEIVKFGGVELDLPDSLV